MDKMQQAIDYLRYFSKKMNEVHFIQMLDKEGKPLFFLEEGGDDLLKSTTKEVKSAVNKILNNNIQDAGFFSTSMVIQSVSFLGETNRKYTVGEETESGRVVIEIVREGNLLIVNDDEGQKIDIIADHLALWSYKQIAVDGPAPEVTVSNG